MAFSHKSTNKGSRRDARCVKTDVQRVYRQAKDCLRKCTKNGLRSVLQRVQDRKDIFRELQQAIGWTQDTCRNLDQQQVKMSGPPSKHGEVILVERQR